VETLCNISAVVFIMAVWFQGGQEVGENPAKCSASCKEKVGGLSEMQSLSSEIILMYARPR
jgi:hypothetical protein